MSSTHRIDREAFLANLRKSNLLAPEQYDAVVAELPGTERSLSLARALVKPGVLTKFQAEMLLAGRTSGFTLGQYRVLDQLGRGGMGRVFKAIHQTMNRVVALKVDELHNMLSRVASSCPYLHRVARCCPPSTLTGG